MSASTSQPGEQILIEFDGASWLAMSEQHDCLHVIVDGQVRSVDGALLDGVRETTVPGRARQQRQRQLSADTDSARVPHSGTP